MIKKVLEKAGFVENKTYKECRFLKTPSVTYAIYTDNQEHRGADNKDFLVEHDYEIEIYSRTPDKETEKRIEEAFKEFGIEFEKLPRYWLQDEQLYQVIYEFKILEK